jgi:hypothetical protein
MAYEIFTDHPETWERRGANFTSWMFWAQHNAPWTGVGIDQMAEIVKLVCASPEATGDCTILDEGGTLEHRAAERVLKLAGDQMPDNIREVFAQAVSNGYGIRVVFSKGAFGSAMSASQYLAKFGSDAEH